MTIRSLTVACFVVGLAVEAASAQEMRVLAEQVPCLQVQENSVIRTRVENNAADTQVRLYFRRLHEEVEDFYWVEMESQGGGEYWGVLPKPEDEILERRELERIEEDIRERWARWWRQKEILDDRDPNDDLDQEIIEERAQVGKLEERNWMDTLTDESLEEWLNNLEYEPTEYYSAVYDGYGQRLARSPMQVTQVRDDCDTNLTAAEAGLAENLTVGETAAWQKGKEVFHWLCDGIVSRVDPTGVVRGDSICRACLVAWWQKEEFLIPLAAGAGALGVITIDDDDPISVSVPIQNNN